MTTTPETPEPTAPSDADQMSAFSGFTTQDGVAVETPAAPVEPTASAPAPAEPEASGEESGDDGEGGAATEGEQSDRHRSAQARIDKAVARQRAAERRAEELEARLSALEGRAAPPQQPRQPAADAPPDPTQFQGGEFDPKYVAALSRYEARQEVVKAREEAAQATAERQRADAVREFEEKRGKFVDLGVEKYADFEEVALDNSVHISPTVATLAFESDHGPEIVYALAQDSKEQKRVSAMSPARQAAWFGRREAELELSSRSPDAGAESPPPKVTKAPPPPGSTSRGTGGTPKVAADTTDFAQFERMAASQK